MLLPLLMSCAGSGGSLNSDLIERRYGSYGVEVLQQSEDERISSLYSAGEDGNTTRTYAVTRYLAGGRRALAAEHAAILAGQSIGQTFRNAGWEIRKQSTYIGALNVPAGYTKLAERMRIALPAEVAVHEYLFVVTREQRSYTYAQIIEVHHPDYLSVEALQSLYGRILFDDSNRDAIHEFIGPPPGK